MEKAKLVEILSREFRYPIRNMNTLNVGCFSSLMNQAGTTDLRKLHGNPQYEEIIDKGLILGYKERRMYNNEDYGYHWGIDVMCKEGTPVFAADSGEIMWQEKVADLREDYGGSTYGNFVIFENYYEGTKVYTLYGHLANIDGRFLRGDKVKRGEQIGIVGKAFTKENGGWPPHLHFQIGLSIRGLDAYDGLELEKETVNPLEVFGLQ